MELLRRIELEKKTGLSRSAIYAKMDATSKTYDPDFPRPIQLGGRAVAWVVAEVDLWIRVRITAARGDGHAKS